MSEKERRGLDLYSKLYPHVLFLDVAPDVDELGYTTRFAGRSSCAGRELRGARDPARRLDGDSAALPACAGWDRR